MLDTISLFDSQLSGSSGQVEPRAPICRQAPRWRGRSGVQMKTEVSKSGSVPWPQHPGSGRALWSTGKPWWGGRSEFEPVGQGEGLDQLNLAWGQWPRTSPYRALLSEGGGESPLLREVLLTAGCLHPSSKLALSPGRVMCLGPRHQELLKMVVTNRLWPQ